MKDAQLPAAPYTHLDRCSTLQFSAVLFDLDGTILDSAESGVIATQRAFAMHGLPTPEAERVVALMGIPIEESFPQLARRSLIGDALDALLRDFRAIYREVTDAGLNTFPGMIELLSRLSEHGVRLAIVTSKHSAVARRNMVSVGIDLLFEVVVGPDMIQQPKPAPDTALAAMRALGELDGGRALVVGDACYDILMGKAAGLSTCAVTWGAHSEAELSRCGPSWVTRSVEELTQLLLGRVSEIDCKEYGCA